MFQVGDEVVCVNANGLHPRQHPLVEGDVYVISEVAIIPYKIASDLKTIFKSEHVAVLVNGWPAPVTDSGILLYHEAKRFVKVQRKGMEILDEIRRSVRAWDFVP